MDQEYECLATLGEAVTYSIEEEQFKIMDSAGDPILVFDAAVIGTITGPEDETLPEDAVIAVKLNDVSLADAPAVTIGEQTITNVTEFPIPFAVTYDPRLIEGNHTYTISARIEDSSGNLLFINTSADNVITRGSPSQIEVVVDPV
jgi:putative lipoprotein